MLAHLVVPSSASAWGFEAHKLIVSRAIDILPAPLRPFFDANRAFIVERSIDPDLWRTAGFTEEPPNHFVDLDYFGKGRMVPEFEAAAELLVETGHRPDSIKTERFGPTGG